jgi:hypothetical protein
VVVSRESEEEDEEENRYLASLLVGDPKNRDSTSEPTQLQAEAATASDGWGRQVPEGEQKEEKRDPWVDFCGGALPVKEKPRRRMLRKRKVCRGCAITHTDLRVEHDRAN